MDGIASLFNIRSRGDAHDILLAFRYPYPIFEALNTPYRAALFAVSALLMVASTTTLKWLYRSLNGLDDGRLHRARPGAVKAE